MSVRTVPYANRVTRSLGKSSPGLQWTVRPQRPTNNHFNHSWLLASRVRTWKNTPVSFGVIAFQDGTSSVNGKSATVSGLVQVPRRGKPTWAVCASTARGVFPSITATSFMSPARKASADSVRPRRSTRCEWSRGRRGLCSVLSNSPGGCSSGCADEQASQTAHAQRTTTVMRATRASMCQLLISEYSSRDGC
jgi:hypothetical protein